MSEINDYYYYCNNVLHLIQSKLFYKYHVLQKADLTEIVAETGGRGSGIALCPFDPDDNSTYIYISKYHIYLCTTFNNFLSIISFLFLCQAL